MVLLREKAGTGGVSIQMIFVISAEEHELPPTFNVIVYVPGKLKIGHVSFVPEIQVFVFDDPLLSLPKAPLPIVKPVEGVITQTNFGAPQDVLEGIPPPIVVLVKHIGLFVHRIVCGILKLTIGGVETRIGTTDPNETSQGFEASIVAENEFC
jgi:hypothetical protein